MNAIYIKSDPIQSLVDLFKTQPKVPLIDRILLNISEDEKKSLLLLSNIIFKTHLRNFLDKNINIPSSIPILKYKPTVSDFTIKDQMFTIDLLLISGYLKTYRNRMEIKTDDVSATKSIMYLAFRCFVDVFYFSVLENLSADFITTNVLEHFKHYDEKGFFKKFNENLVSYGLEPVSQNDISTFINSVLKVIFENKVSITNIHDEMFKTNLIKVPSKNSFTKEQILNDIIKIEVYRRLGNKIEKLEDLNKLSIDDPEIIKNYMDNNIEVKTVTKTNLLRFVEENISEVPTNVKDDFITYVKTLNSSNFDYFSFNFQIRDFGENIVKALYVWKPQGEEKIKTNYLTYVERIKSTILTKDDIINLVSVKHEDTESGWDNIVI
jgi:hypothetical protein